MSIGNRPSDRILVTMYLRSQTKLIKNRLVIYTSVRNCILEPIRDVSRIYAHTVVFHYRFPRYRTILDAYVLLPFILHDNTIYLLMLYVQSVQYTYIYIYIHTCISLFSFAKDCDTMAMT